MTAKVLKLGSFKIKRFVANITEVRYNDDMENILSKIEKTDYCWNWLGGLKLGYGRIQVGENRYQAHRFIYELMVGKIPEGLEIDHLCFNRRCVNPKHLEPVTHAENLRRATRKRMQTKTFCKHGHPMVGENIYIVIDKKTPGKTWRNCKICKVEANRKWRSQL